MRKLLLVASLLSAGYLWAGDLRFQVSEIPDSLKKGADAVVRERITSFTIVSINRAFLNVREVITVLHGGGKRHAQLSLPYSKLEKITSIKGTLYNASGESVGKLKPSDILDESAADGFSLYSDQRVKTATLTYHEYPYTVEFEYEMDYKYLYAIPGCVVGEQKVSIQKLVYQLIYPKDLQPRVKPLRLESPPAREAADGGREKLSWTFSSIRPVIDEPNGPEFLDLVPRIMAAPTAFEYDGFAGDMTTWESYGKWNIQLLQGRGNLPEAAKEKVRSLVAGVSTTEGKAKILYEYLQHKTRYVSIQEGIGGLQPFPAEVVESTSYGDCKALSNYMIVLLKEAGIKGYYTRIRAGVDEPDLVADFPSHQTNHIIVAVPNGKDTLWMECTSQKTPFNYLGRFTGNRTALMITEEGGRLVRTPGFRPDENKQIRLAEVTVQANGNATAKVKTLYTGEQFENDGLDAKLESPREELKKWIEENTDIPSFSVGAFSISAELSKKPTATVNFELALNQFASVSGKRLFITPNLMSRVKYVPEKVENRKTEVVRSWGYVDIDTVVFRVPEEFHPEFIPPKFSLASPFGQYDAEIDFSSGQIRYVRRLKMVNGRFGKETYPELINFFKGINKADNLRLVLVSKS